MKIRWRETRRRGCGKCGKAALFCATLFQASGGNPRFLRISTDASFSTAPRARRFSSEVEEPDIRNGKNPSKIRGRIQTSTDRPDRSRPPDRRSGRARSTDIQKPNRTMARSVSQQRAGRSPIEPGTPIGGREREAQGQDRRSGHADGPYKKIASLG